MTSIESVITKAFGKLIRALCEEKQIFDDAGNKTILTLKELAQRADCSVDTVRKIQQGRKRNLSRTADLEPLAKVLGLTEAQKVEFYATAGLVYPYHDWIIDLDKIEEVLRDLTYPANVRTLLWDFVAFNHYNHELYGFKPEIITARPV